MLDSVTVARMRALSGEGAIMVALSGGGDSTALLHLLRAEFGADKLLAGVVDHGLRAGSEADARCAAGVAAALGVRTEILTLQWPGGLKRAQRPARRARYRALCSAARAHGAQVIALAHSGDDQAETVLMRAAAGSNWRGLAGMAGIAPAPVWPEGRGIALARPLLNVRRAAMRAYLSARGAAWLEDPANANPAFERVRARLELARLEAEGFDPMRLAMLATRLGDLRRLLDRAAAALIAEAVRIEGHTIHVGAAAWRAADGEVRKRALSVLIAAASGAEREPSAAAVDRLAPRVVEGFRGATLGGARLRPSAEGFTFGRDPGALLGRRGAGRSARLSLAVGQELIWDNRLILTAPAPGWTVGPGAAAAPELAAPNGQAMTLSQADGSIGWRWLVEERVEHLLGLTAR